MKAIVSVIIPIYNVEKYLHRCILSVLDQTYKNIEVLLVNDGSTDNSLLICNEYVNDPRIILLNKENGGLSDARNFGLDHAKGDYACFVDSDDFIIEDMIEKMVHSIQSTNSDICVCDMAYLYDNEERVQANGGEFTTSSVQEKPNLIGINNSACNKMFKIEMFNDIRFPKGKYYEDLATIPILIYKANKVVKINEVFYIYYQRSGSIAHTASKKIFEIYDAIDTCIDYVKTHGNENKVIEELKHFYIVHGLDLTTLRIKDFDDKNSREEYLIENIDELNRHYPKWRKDRSYVFAGAKKKLIYLLLSRGKARTVLRLYDK